MFFQIQNVFVSFFRFVLSTNDFFRCFSRCSSASASSVVDSISPSLHRNPLHFSSWFLSWWSFKKVSWIYFPWWWCCCCCSCCYSCQSSSSSCCCCWSNCCWCCCNFIIVDRAAVVVAVAAAVEAVVVVNTKTSAECKSVLWKKSNMESHYFQFLYQHAKSTIFGTFAKG